jgi:hypothetical protein
LDGLIDDDGESDGDAEGLVEWDGESEADGESDAEPEAPAAVTTRRCTAVALPVKTIVLALAVAVNVRQSPLPVHGTFTPSSASVLPDS